jgi:hypothetical protein
MNIFKRRAEGRNPSIQEVYKNKRALLTHREKLSYVPSIVISIALRVF